LRESAPQRLAESPAAPGGKAASARTAALSRTIALDVLYVEDDPVNRLLMQEILLERRPATRLTFAEDGLGALAQIQRSLPDLVLMDMNLPDMDGFELLERIRALEDGQEMPCFAMSASAMPDAVAKARAAGFLSFWSKPIDFMGFLPALDAIALGKSAESVT
jgi:CheY-like chemotaxis protein